MIFELLMADVQIVTMQIEQRRSIKTQEYLALHYGHSRHILIRKYCHFYTIINQI